MTEFIVGCLAVVVCIAMLVGGITSCSMTDMHEQTLRIQAACAGNLNQDAARSATCALALQKAHAEGQNN